MRLLSLSKNDNQIVFSRNELPKIAIVVAAFNEEKVIKLKIESILASSYPTELFDIFIGSDNSTDKTNEICESYTKKNSNIFLVKFTKRVGKVGVLNSLFKNYIDKRNYKIIVFTDANVIFDSDSLFHLIKHFKNEQIGQVAANIINKASTKSNEIELQEKSYIKQENKLKNYEGLVFGKSVGAFGACHAIRKELFREIPSDFIVDDFYLSLEVFKQNKLSITEEKALVYEDIPGAIEDEFRRKRRISAGNFQNLIVFIPLIFKKEFSFAFVFFSHKMVRWFGPFLLFAAFTMLAFLSVVAPFYKLYQFLFVLSNLILLSALLDYALKYLNIHVNLFRLLRYFLLMNFALFLGFIDFISGIKTNIWKPTQRNE